MYQVLCQEFYTYNFILFYFILIKPRQEKNYFAHCIDDKIGFHRGKANAHIHVYTQKELLGELARTLTQVYQNSKGRQ